MSVKIYYLLTYLLLSFTFVKFTYNIITVYIRKKNHSMTISSHFYIKWWMKNVPGAKYLSATKWENVQHNNYNIIFFVPMEPFLSWEQWSKIDLIYFFQQQHVVGTFFCFFVEQSLLIWRKFFFLHAYAMKQCCIACAWKKL